MSSNITYYGYLKIPTSFGFNIHIVPHPSITTEKLINLYRLGLNPVAPKEDSYTTRATIIFNNSNNYPVEAAVIVDNKVEEFLATANIYALRAWAGTANTRKTAKETIADKYKSFDDFIFNYNNKILMAGTQASLLYKPNKILMFEEYEKIYCNTEKENWVAERSVKWNTCISDSCAILRNEDQFLITKGGKKYKIDQLEDLLPDLECLYRLEEGFMKIATSSILPGDVKRMPAINIGHEFLDNVIKMYRIPGASSLRKHEKYSAVIEYFTQHPEVFDILPQSFQLAVETNNDQRLVITANPEESDNFKGQLLHFMARLKSIPLGKGMILMGSNSLVPIGERVSFEGQYCATQIISIPKWNSNTSSPGLLSKYTTYSTR